MIKKIISLFGFALVGVISFWLPDLALHFLRRGRFAGIDMFALTLLLPLFSFLAFNLTWKLRTVGISRRLASAAMMLSIWLSGPFFMSAGATFSGGGFAKPGAWRIVQLETAVFPFAMFIDSAYNGSLFALGIVTLYLGILVLGVPKRLLEILGFDDDR